MSYNKYPTTVAQRSQEALDHIKRIFASNTPALLNLKPIQVTYGVGAAFLSVLYRLGTLTRVRTGIHGYEYEPTPLFEVVTGEDLVNLERLRTNDDYAGVIMFSLRERASALGLQHNTDVPAESLPKRRTRHYGAAGAAKYQRALDDLRERFTQAQGKPVHITAKNFQSVHNVGSSLPTILTRLGFIRSVGSKKDSLYVALPPLKFLVGDDIKSVEGLRTDLDKQNELLDTILQRSDIGTEVKFDQQLNPAVLVDDKTSPEPLETWLEVFDRLPKDSKVTDTRPVEYSIVHSSDLPTEEQIRGSYDAGVQDTRAKVFEHLMDASRAAFSQEDDVIALLLRTLAKEYKD